MSLAMISWGVAWTNAKIVNEYFSYTNLVFLRYFSSFIFFIPIIFFRKSKLAKHYLKVALSITTISFLYYIYNVFFFMGTDIGTAGKGGVFVTTTNPIITFLIISIINKSINKTQILGISLGALGGFIILDVFSLGVQSIFINENLYFLICSITWGIITVVMSYGQKEYDSISYIFFCYFITSLISLFFVDINEILTPSNYSSHFLINFFLYRLEQWALGHQFLCMQDLV